ncbi:hypothetical protein [Marseilla massiliensis]|uniref:Uncharacterized protein n=1 Tax=Marseilla massiliensis TaxID=1841864 RepID=A0A938WR08_9BACT|nr:hypothetical protein [Marseilla massiliensis]MBM6672524.1 hypothetical protein [Marseilla massiliensis]
MDAKLIDLTSKRYCKYSLWLVVAMTLCGFVAMSVNWIEISLLNALAVSAIYSIVINLLYGFFWKKVAKSASGIIARFYLGVSALRLMTAALVVLAFCMLNDGKEVIRNFIIVFFAFYIVMLIFDSVFFARIEKYNNLKTDK